MLSELVITDANGNERPDVNVNGTSVTVDQGQTATIKGTYDDRDGDPVTLTSSVGTVTDNGGGGNWTWTYKAGAEDTSKMVYVTATDSQGLKGQVPFQLKVNPTAPTIDTLKVTPKKFTPKGSKKPHAAAKKKKKKATISFNLSKASNVNFTVKRIKPKKPKKAAKTFTQTLTAGAQAVKFTGRFNNKALPPGKYSLTAVATDTGGRVSAPVSTKFKIVSP
jgi:hypothetical protein